MAFCTECGTNVPNNVKFCTECGAPVAPPVQQPPMQPQQPQQPAAYAGGTDTVIGMGGYIGMTLLFCVPVVGFIACIVFAATSKNLNRRNFAKAMLVFLIIGLVLSVFVWIAATWAWEVVEEYAKGMITS
jgi:predicted nucleic acid-binding Zn ribbon protein